MAWPSYAHVLDVDVDIGGMVNHGCAPCSKAQTEIAEQATKPHGLAMADEPACIQTLEEQFAGNYLSLIS